MEIKQIRELKRLFNEKTEETTTIPESDYKMYLDSPMVMGFIPKNTKIKMLFETIFESQPETLKMLDYTSKFDGESSCNYSIEYLIKILEFLKKSKEEIVLLKLKKDYPLWVETKEFILILAQRTE